MHYQKKICVKAPSNIAWIKYMGKQAENIPENPSLSMTLNHLATYVSLEMLNEEALFSLHWDDALPSLPENLLLPYPLKHVLLSVDEKERIYGFFDQQKDTWLALGMPLKGKVLIRSANTFPMSSGIASSASAFAALTYAWAHMAGGKIEKKDLENLSSIARKGSGSACRSFFGPWALWEGSFAKPWSPPAPTLHHFVAIVHDAPKNISSSQAHKLVKTSSLWKDRPERAYKRYLELQQAFHTQAWDTIANLVFLECMDMHSLFHTSQKPFSYWTHSTMKLLSNMMQWMQHPLEHPLIVTMDAGANIHFSVLPEGYLYWKDRLFALDSSLIWLEDTTGKGCELIL